MKGHSCNPAPVPHLADHAAALRSDQAQGSALYSQDRVLPLAPWDFGQVAHPLHVIGEREWLWEIR